MRPRKAQRPVQIYRGSGLEPRSPDAWLTAGSTMPGCSRRPAKCRFREKRAVASGSLLPHLLHPFSLCCGLHLSPLPPSPCFTCSPTSSFSEDTCPSSQAAGEIGKGKERQEWVAALLLPSTPHSQRHTPHTPHSAYLHSQPQPLTAGPASVKAASLP